jgi:outer membrane protein, heavy metal efflux system
MGRLFTSLATFVQPAAIAEALRLRGFSRGEFQVRLDRQLPGPKPALASAKLAILLPSGHQHAPMKSVQVLLFGIFFVNLGRAAEEAVETRSFTLARVIDEALRESPSIKAALSKWRAMRARVPQAAAWDDPKVSADFNAARFVTVPPNAFMDQTVTLEQMIPVSGKNRVRARAAAAEALAAFEEVRRQQLDVVTKVRTSYLRLLNSYALLDPNEKNIASLRQIADVARSRYEAGKELATDVLLAETEASKLEETRRNIERMISDEKSQLNVLMNRDAFSPLGMPRKETIRPMDWTLPQLRSLMQAHRPEIRTAQAKIETEKEKVSLARREWIPDPAIMVQGQRYNETQHMVSDLSTGISFSIPWVNYEKYSAGTKEALSNLAAAQAELDRVQKNSLGLLRDQLQKIETTRHHAELFQKEILPQAEKAFAASRSAYESGTGEFSAWLTMQRLLRETQAAALNHLTDHQIAIVELEGIVGSEICPTPSKTQKSK